MIKIKFRLLILITFIFLISGCSFIRYYGFTLDQKSTPKSYDYYSAGGYKFSRNSKESQFVTNLYSDDKVSFRLIHLSCSPSKSELRVSKSHTDEPVNLEILEVKIDIYHKGKKAKLVKSSSENPDYDWDNRMFTYTNYYRLKPFVRTLEQKISIRFVLNGVEHHIKDSFKIKKKFQYDAAEMADSIEKTIMSI